MSGLFGVRPREYPVALDAVLVHVHPSNPVSALDFDQLSGLFSGRIRNWKEVGGKDQPVVLYGRESSSGTYEFFRETVLRGGNYSSSLQPLQGSAQVAASVAADPGGLGFSGGLPGAGTRRLRLAQRPGQPRRRPPKPPCATAAIRCGGGFTCMSMCRSTEGRSKTGWPGCGERKASPCWANWASTD